MNIWNLTWMLIRQKSQWRLKQSMLLIDILFAYNQWPLASLRLVAEFCGWGPHRKIRMTEAGRFGVTVYYLQDTTFTNFRSGFCFAFPLLICVCFGIALVFTFSLAISPSYVIWTSNSWTLTAGIWPADPSVLACFSWGQPQNTSLSNF